MSARTELVALLLAELPAYTDNNGAAQSYRVAGSTTLDRLDTRTILLWQTNLDPFAAAGRDGVKVTLTLRLLTPYADGDAADDDLDDGLLDVLGVLLPVSWVVWTDAERGVFQEWHGYKITLTAAGAVTEQEA